MSLVASPSELFPEISLQDYFKPPPEDPFPENLLRTIISPPPKTNNKNKDYVWEAGPKTFRHQWVPPDNWDEQKEVRKIQWEGFARGREGWENEAERKVREERKEAVRRGFAYGWQGYKDFAWGHDEVKPVSEDVADPFNGWGASIVDTLGTLLVMGLSDEFNLCRAHVNQINFHWFEGRDWSQGYSSEPSPTDDDETPAEIWSMPRDRTVLLPVFETSIRYLGGLLSAYDLSGDKMILDRCVELADIIGSAFNTESGIPAGRMDPGNPGDHRLGSISIAEAGSMTVEFMRLALVTGNRTYFDWVQCATDYLDQRVIPRSVIPPLIPLMFQPDSGLGAKMDGAFAWGGMADSYYEYLIKTYKLLGGSEIAQQYKRIYEESVIVSKKNLFTDIDYIPDHPILAIGKIEHGRFKPEIEHLTCFAGGMLAMGAKLLQRQEDMEDAEKFTNSCYWVSQVGPLGLQPEHVEFYNPDHEEVWDNVDETGRIIHPYVDEAELKAKGADVGRTYKDKSGVIRWSSDKQPVLEADGGTGPNHNVKTVKKLRGKLPGIKGVGPRYINRPETVESLFYMFRLTGDRKWQDKGWKMFVSWMTASKVSGGFSSVTDVTKSPPKYGDNMESFAFAELFKYHYLLQSEPDFISLDDYVFNTEAHPLIANRDILPGSQRLWRPPTDPDADLGVRGQGTDVQKWKRQSVLWKGRETHKQVKAEKPEQHQGGGKGMGGGGGRPGYIPPLPPGFGNQE
ncbi:glycosyl hydrolase family 47-domain-containing protein [Kockovaella imperatae]|uniref:alpha-1,2-Mannosidase n=1 Tax=Kockovaella imperatae TaxID=4999 RepID=A0A1Y1U8G0_9TREE|nr:glycosyl hydrolase family 47-domain-containing protein [Kockovaella imperatae]ORX33405.1 glycosyl hydrolase family 47-domain-containing protein [Kockovaella imperatae]